MLVKTLVIAVLLANAFVQGQEWRQARLTHYTSWPRCCNDPDWPDQEECEEYNGCQWAGYFAFVQGQKDEAWVEAHNIIAVHEKDAQTYKLKTLEVRMNGVTTQATVYDMCADSDCNGCCTDNAGSTGFLIDMESYTYARFGQSDGIVEWRCVDC